MITTYGIPLEVVQELVRNVYGLGVMSRVGELDAMPNQWERICESILRAANLRDDVKLPLDIDCGEY